MINWFEIFADKLTAIEEAQREILHYVTKDVQSYDANPYGDFKWLVATCQGVPPSTLRVKSAAGEIPGMIKFGKRVLYEKEAVLSWLKSQTRQPSSANVNLEQLAEEQLNQQLTKRRR